jgi:hypothetical protein
MNEKLAAIGFLDCDGSITLRRPTAKRKNTTPVITAGQSQKRDVPEELLQVQRLYGGSIHQKCRPNRESHRQAWVLSIVARDQVEVVLKDIVAHGHLKKRQAALAIEALEQPTKSAEHAERISAFNQSVYVDAVISPTSLSYAYLAGVFAADGYVAVTTFGKVIATITKRICPPFLDAVAKFVGAGGVFHADTYRINCGQAATFLQCIEPYLFGQKVAQLRLAIQYQSDRPSRHKRRTQEDLNAREGVISELKRLKKL